MTKTKSQKMRAALTQRKGVAAKDFNFLNGNSLNLSLKRQQKVAAGLLGIAAKRQGKQSRDYMIAPVAKSFKGLSARAKITTMSSGVTRVKHSEYIKDVDGSMDFTVDANPINPGESALFPWLSSIADRFESYQFRNLNFRYETTSPTSTAGSVIITVDYNPQASPPDSKVQALAMESSVRTAPWGSVNHRSLPHNLSKRKSYYINNGDPSVFDPDLFDTGVMMVMTEGIPTETGSVGEMYVDYEVDLITPTLTNFSTSGASGELGAMSLNNPGDFRYLYETGVTVTPSDAPFTAGPGFSVNVGGQNVGGFQFQEAGAYLVTVMFTSSTITLPEVGWLLGSSSDLTVTQVVPVASGTVALDTTTNTATATFVVTQQKEAAPFSGILGFGNTTTNTDTGVVTSLIYIAPFNLLARRPRRRAKAAVRHIGTRRPVVREPPVVVTTRQSYKEAIKPRPILENGSQHPLPTPLHSVPSIRPRVASAAIPIPRVKRRVTIASTMKDLHGLSLDCHSDDDDFDVRTV